MEYNATERSNCGVNFTTEDLDQLESVEEMYFKTREIEEEDDEDDYSDSNSSSDDEGEALIKIKLLRSWKYMKRNVPKCKHFTRKPVM